MAITIKDVKGTFGQATSSQLAAFAADPTNGDLIVALVAIFNLAGATFGISDTASNAYTQIGSNVTQAGIPGTLALFYAKNITGGSGFRVTLTISASRHFAWTAWAVTGVDADPYNGDIMSAVGTTQTAAPGASAVTPAANSIHLGAMCVGSTTVPANPSGWNTTGVNGFTAGMDAAAGQEGFATNFDIFTAYKLSGAIENPQWDLTVAGQPWAALTASFKPGVAAGGGSSRRRRTMYGSPDRQREFYGSISGGRAVAAADTGTITLVAAVPKHTLYIQTIHVEVTTLAASEVWAFRDGAGTPVPVGGPVSAAALGHFDLDFGAQGLPLTEGTAFNLNISGATGAIGQVTWEGYKKLTAGAAA